MSGEWLTPEQAVVEASLTVTAETLQSYVSEPQENTTAEERFQALGLLFNRERWRTGKVDFLQLLQPTTDEESDTEDEDDSDISEVQVEPYIFDQCKVQIVITLLPDTGQPEGRPVILAASSHGDFPIISMLNQKELGTLPPAIVQLLDELKADFPNRQIRHSITKTQTTKTNQSRTPKTPTHAQTTNSNPTQLTTSSSTQISLF